jgi:hypothetical protein
MKYTNKSIAVPIEFDKQDEGHSAHNPLTWKVITTYYVGRGVYPYKMYNNKQVLTCAFEGKQTNNDELVKSHFKAKREREYGVYIRNLR